MGDIADMMIEGLLCQQCGSHIDGETPGHPRYCADCEYEHNCLPVEDDRGNEP